MQKITNRLRVLDDVGLGYLRLGQSATTLSGGEAQRIKLAAHLLKRTGAKTLYIFDEPTTGLHFDDINKLLAAFRALIDAGGSLLVIEHNLDVIKTADHIIDLGAEGGDAGGYVVGVGTPEEIMGIRKSYTGLYLARLSCEDQTAILNRIPLRRRLLYVGVIYIAFLLVLLSIELITRVTRPHLASLDLFVTSPQQKMQIANPQQSAIFEADPLLLWRLKPNLDRAVWDFTVLSTNAQGFRADYPIGAKASGTIRIVCLGDSVTFGYRVPPVWPEKPNDYNPDWLPFPMLLEKELRKANPNRQIEVFPMAVPGYTSHQGLAWLRRDIGRLQPDLVIASFGWNDVSMSDVPDRESINTGWVSFASRWLTDHSQAFAHAQRWFHSRNGSAKSARGLFRVWRRWSMLTT